MGHEQPTRYLAGQLGIDHYFAEVLPEDKAGLVAHLQQQGKTVCFIGDGINEATGLRLDKGAGNRVRFQLFV
ncbi:MAG: HAD family hydrolase [Lewinellaceae bacterium]|nr:HAD family hydrolase [Lewinellaceae bacterium]